MDVQSSYPVVIVGAGPVGVAAATLLAQYGIGCLILERWADLYPQPRAVHLDDEVFRILDRIGIGEEFAGIARPALGLRLLDPSMRVLAEFRRDPTRSRHGHPEANMFDQPALEALLRTNLKRYAAATLRGDAEVTAITDLPGDRHRIRFTDRRDGTEHGVDCDFLLGCDGANSLVRRHIGATMRDLRFEQRWLVIDIAAHVDLNQWGGVHQVCDPRRAGTFMQIGDERYRWEFRLLPGESSDDFGTLAALRPLIAPWLGSTDDADLRVLRVAEYTFRAQVADRWRRGTVFLLGDAAHLTPPFIGQGLCAGLRDAMNLSWKLAGVVKGYLPAEALDSYQRERKPHARSMISLALAIGHFMTAGGRLGDALRRAALPRVHRIPGLASRLVDSATPALRRSALVRRRHLRRSLAGKLCPNAVTPGGTRLDTQTGSGFCIITTTAPTPEQTRSILGRGAALHYAEPGSAIADWLAAGSARAVLVRPDFAVMAVMRSGRDLAPLCEGLPAFG